jgi:hypothetical protein
MIKDEENLIQVYGPKEPHGPQAIVVNEAGQKALKKALDEGKAMATINAITADGNGCYIKLIMASAEIIEAEYDLPFTENKQNEEKIDPRMIQDIR